ncbi:MAG: SPOR domain-containing protein [Gammaproteobacteria bacterium]
MAQYRAGTVLFGIEPESVIKPELEQQHQIDTDEPGTSSRDPGSESELINKDTPEIKAQQGNVSSTAPAKLVTNSTRSKPQSISKKKPITQNMAEATEPDTGLAAPSVTSSKLKYSVQAGLFGNQGNANRFLYQLQTAGFDGYMDEHLGDDGVIRYNVRFGRFASRVEAEQRLDIYRQGFNTPAYVIINP